MTASTPAPDRGVWWADRVLLRVEVGSTAHGTGIEGREDYDELGVFAPAWPDWIGVPVPAAGSETIVYRPGRAASERSGPGDYDLTVHAARKFARLASSGNPSLVMVFFGPLRYSHPSGLGDDLRRLASAFWSEHARRQFLGYATAQRERLLGIRGGRHTNRPELVETHGYDTKYAMHMLRLGLQGLEYMRAGNISLPMQGTDAEFLRAVRRGEVPLDEVLRLAEGNEAELASMQTPAPDEPDWRRINAWLSEVYEWTRSAIEG